jgi:hypothetical protein
MFFIFAIISFSIAYKRAKVTGRNGFIWGIFAAATFIATGLTFTFGVGVILGIGIELWNWRESIVEGVSIIGAIVSVIASFATTWLILRHLNKVPEESLAKPPLPPIFEQKD